MDRTTCDILAEIAPKGYLFEPTAEKLRQVLNDIIDEYELDHATVLASLARLSAAYVYQLQRNIDDAHGKQVMKDGFNTFFEAFLEYSKDVDLRQQQEEKALNERLEKN